MEASMVMLAVIVVAEAPVDTGLARLRTSSAR